MWRCLVGAECKSAGIAARTLANIADVLGALSRGAGGLRSGPASNRRWNCAFQLLEVCTKSWLPILYIYGLLISGNGEIYGPSIHTTFLKQKNYTENVPAFPEDLLSPREIWWRKRDLTANGNVTWTKLSLQCFDTVGWRQEGHPACKSKSCHCQIWKVYNCFVIRR